ncbi:hypothetical protein ACH44C_00965 [Streptomyces purpureus]|uniref:hypothetical protein n=1 Tax=Streptomyces purpureus TaxID=1951 RepID=UPI00378B1C9E
MNAQEAALLRLLAEGLTDKAAARELGVSLRTEPDHHGTLESARRRQPGSNWGSAQ